MRGLFVTATDTGVGKTILSAALLAAMVAAGEPVRAYKPVITGLDDEAEIAKRGGWPPDHELLAAAAGMDAEAVAPLRFGPAVSPQLAAQLAHERIAPEQLERGARCACEQPEGADRAATERDAARGSLIVEGVGGLLVPLADEYTVRDLAAALRLPVLIAARPGLGTINHTMLTLQSARAAELEVRAVVLTPWQRQPTTLERSNRETIARLGDVEVQTLAPVRSPDPLDLAQAGSALPWRRWLGDPQRP